MISLAESRRGLFSEFVNCNLSVMPYTFKCKKPLIEYLVAHHMHHFLSFLQQTVMPCDNANYCQKARTKTEAGSVAKE